jgi:hypothetical protein
MTPGRCIVRVAAICFLAASLPAQNQRPANPQKLLPSGAKIIETANLSAVAGKPRELVLWMQDPKTAVRVPNAGYCGDAVYGDSWIGPTRLSLVDPVNQKLLNTIHIVGPAFSEDPADSFRLPFLVGNYYYYYVRQTNSQREGKPTILKLRDLTGDGIAAEFVLFMYGACGIAETTVFGYDKQSDRAVQYLIEVDDRNGQPTIEKWVSQIFATEPITPGRWDFTWDPGHGADSTIHDQVSFDKKRQVFVDKQTITPHPDTVLPK